jgi:hypothetical protein
MHPNSSRSIHQLADPANRLAVSTIQDVDTPTLSAAA